MKLSHLSPSALVAVVALALVGPVASMAQSTQTNQATCPSPNHYQCGEPKGHCNYKQGRHHWGHEEQNAWINLSESERQQLKADVAKIHNDPQLVAARKSVCSDSQALRQTKRELLLKADPSIKPLLNKIEREERWAHIRNWFSRVINFGKCSKHHCDRGHEIWSKLSDTERQQLKADMEKIHEDPNFVAAHKTLWNDVKALHQVKHDLLLKVDPSIKPVLDKMGQCRPENRHHHCWEGKGLN